MYVVAFICIYTTESYDYPLHPGSPKRGLELLHNTASGLMKSTPEVPYAQYLRIPQARVQGKVTFRGARASNAWADGPETPQAWRSSIPEGSKYPIFEGSGSNNHTLNGIWDQRP